MLFDGVLLNGLTFGFEGDGPDFLNVDAHPCASFGPVGAAAFGSGAGTDGPVGCVNDD